MPTRWKSSGLMSGSSMTYEPWSVWMLFADVYVAYLAQLANLLAKTTDACKGRSSRVL